MNKLIFCGDTFLMSRDEANPFAGVLTLFEVVRICVNLETSLSGDAAKVKNVCLRVEEDRLDMIPEQVKVISLVNNHVWDSGNPERLVRELKNRNKIVVGPDNPSQAHVILDGVSVGLFSAYFNLPRFHVSYYGPTANTLEKMISESTAERKIVNLHWGYEHTDVPAPFQRQLAYRLIDAGADIIIGHHPHVPQGWEDYKGKPIYYSLGNFNFWHFDNEPSENNRWGYMVEYDINSGEARPVPYRINDNYQPCQVTQEDAVDLHGRLRCFSDAISDSDYTRWFSTEYAQWYKRESVVWKRRCVNEQSPVLCLKWIVWMMLPLQWKYRFYKLKRHFYQGISK